MALVGGLHSLRTNRRLDHAMFRRVLQSLYDLATWDGPAPQRVLEVDRDLATPIIDPQPHDIAMDGILVDDCRLSDCLNWSTPS